MRVQVPCIPDEAVSAPTVNAIDVLGATSTITQALAAGYRRVLCVPEIEDARALRAELPDRVGGGERVRDVVPRFARMRGPAAEIV